MHQMTTDRIPNFDGQIIDRGQDIFVVGRPCNHGYLVLADLNATVFSAVDSKLENQIHTRRGSKEAVLGNLLGHVQHQRPPFLPFKSPDTRCAITTACHKTAACVAVLNAINMILNKNQLKEH